MKIFSLSLLLAWWALEAAPAAAVAAAEAAAATNYEILRDISGAAAREIVAGIGAMPPEAIVRLAKTKGAGDADFLVENALVEEMRAAGIRTAVDAKENAASPDSAGFTLSYQVVRLAMRYTRISRRYWFGTKEVVREARVDLVARFIDRRTGDVLWTREGSGGYDDVIAYSLLSRVEEEQYGFTKPERTEFKMSRIIEPVIVAGIVVGLVALFFSNQSGND